MLSAIHHVNFIVKDLNQAVERYACLLTGHDFKFDELDQRGVKTARVKLGQTWLVLVQPVDDTGIPAQHLREHGEGFFLMSFLTDNLDDEVSRCEANQLADAPVARQGLDHWRVADLDSTAFFGANIQITEDTY